MVKARDPLTEKIWEAICDIGGEMNEVTKQARREWNIWRNGEPLETRIFQITA